MEKNDFLKWKTNLDGKRVGMMQICEVWIIRCISIISAIMHTKAKLIMLHILCLRLLVHFTITIIELQLRHLCRFS